ncbi:MAG: folate-binding protein YgfZ [Legionellaceae bacterium]|nr:folate-binding protein YgfZ [Legionellaceae bacterium]
MPIEHLINNRQLMSNDTLPNELVFDTNKNYIFELNYLGGLDLQGDKAAEFLQGQLSCDIREVNAQQMRPGAMCNLQGRIIALMDVVEWNGLHLILPKDQLETTQTNLAKAALFSRVTLKPNQSLQLFGFYLQNKEDTIPFDAVLPMNKEEVISTETYCCYQITEQLYLFLTHENTIKNGFDKAQYRGSLAWHALQLQAGYIEIYPASRGLFLPHRLGLQRTSYLSFNKGCYKGQEIIARTHYRAKLKHSMKLFTIETTDILFSGQKMLDIITKAELGEVIDYCPIGLNQYTIAISSIFEHENTIHLEKQQENCMLK